MYTIVYFTDRLLRKRSNIPRQCSSYLHSHSNPGTTRPPLIRYDSRYTPHLATLVVSLHSDPTLTRYVFRSLNNKNNI